jgi:Carboxypeptidase regulatory-like domain
MEFSMVKCLYRGVLACAAVLASAAPIFAQSAVAGVVRDQSGLVLPGVTVEVSSPVLIEKVRTAVTDGSGQYKVVDLRPGNYTVVFTLPGFSTATREGIQLPAAFTATVNIELQLGSLQENVTITGAAPLVDVQNAVQQSVVNREVLDAIPTGRNVFSVGQLIPGTTTNRPDVGGTEGMQQQSFQVHGSETRDISFQVDGMSVNSNYGNAGIVGVYYNDGMMEEISYQTNALPAEVSSGGIRINMIPREGGNTFHGSLFATGAGGGLQTDNFSDELRARGMTAVNSIDQLYDVNFSLGGPIKRDRVWFFGTARRWGASRLVANTFNPDRTQAVDENHITSTVGRLTYQATGSNKISAYYDKNVKYRGHRRDLTGDYQFVDPQASYLQTTPLGYTAQLKWSSIATQRLLVESGMSLMFLHYKTGYRPEVGNNDLARIDFVQSTLTGAAPRDYDSFASRRTFSSTVSYVTGSHAVKVGVQFANGPYRETYTMHGDMQLRFNNGTASAVDLFNTPVDVRESLNADLGIYAQDQWNIGRLTVNPGVRFEHFNAAIRDQRAGAGAFVPERELARIDDVPNWNDVVPRLGVAYDLFGTGRTAIKASASKYMQNEGIGLAHSVNPMYLSRDRRTWTDVNGDGLAQMSELGPSNGFSGGVNQRFDPDLARPYSWEYSASLQHQLAEGLSVSAAYYRRNARNLYGVKNLLVTPADYSPVTIANPIAQGSLVVYNQNAATRGLLDLLVSNYSELDKKYDGVELKVDKRFAGGALLFGGLTVGRKFGSIRGTTDDLNDPNELINANGYVDLDSTVQFKLAGTYPLPLGVQLSGTLQSSTGLPLRRTYTVTRAVVPDLTQASIGIDLLPRGDMRLERLNQFDLRFEKQLTIGTTKLSGLLDMYNVLNTNVTTAEVEAVGSTLGRPVSILDGRLIRLGGKLTF